MKEEEFLNKQGLQKLETFTRKHVKELLQQYADEVSREKQKTAFGAGRRYESYLRTKAKRLNTPHYMPNFDNWLKGQEEQK